MANIIITGTFSGSNNNRVKLDIYKVDPNGFDYKNTFDSTFEIPKETFEGLISGVTYTVDFNGHTTGSFALSISGDVVSEVNSTCNNEIDDSVTFTVK